MNTFNSHYRFVSWINEHIAAHPEILAMKHRLYANPSPAAANILLDPGNLDKIKQIDWRNIASNTNDFRLIERVVEHITNHLVYSETERDALWADLCWNDRSSDAVAAVLSHRKQIDFEILTILYRNKYAGAYIHDMSLTNEKRIMIASSDLFSNSCSDAVKIILDNRHLISSWADLASNTNPTIIAMLIAYAPEKLWETPDIWKDLSSNTCPLAISFLMTNPAKIDWLSLSGNHSREAVAILSTNIDKINWRLFCANPLPEALVLIKANPDKIDIAGLAANTNLDAFAMLGDGSLTITEELWAILTANPLIFERVYNMPRIIV